MTALRGWIEIANQRAPRERLLIGASLMVALFLLAELALLRPLAATRASATAELTNLHAEATVRRARHTELAAALQQRERERGAAALQTLARESARLDSLLRDKTVPVISPSEMVTVLREMFAADDTVTLTIVENAAAREAFAPAAEPAQSDAPPAAGAAALPKLYKHPLSLEFTGNFAKIVEYLKRIEALDWQLVWDDFSIVMEQYPVARARVVLHTLGLRREWIGA